MGDVSVPLLSVRDLRCGYRDHEVVHGVSFDVARGEFVCIIGANGCGKTTTLKALLGLIKPSAGSVSVCGEEVTHMNDRDRARHFAYIPQAHTPPFPFTVADVVLLGRTPYINHLAQTTSHDRRVAYRALELLSIADLADSIYTQLSGGQRQLVLIARALTQQPDLMVMDEPTASLDFGNQQVVLVRMRMLARLGMSVVMVTHDPDHALFCADRVIVMEDGQVIGEGTSAQTITTECLDRIYHSNVRVIDADVGGGRTVRVCVPLPDDMEREDV
jgi:iron complex transport system ATP-binding protein